MDSFFFILILNLGIEYFDIFLDLFSSFDKNIFNKKLNLFKYAIVFMAISPFLFLNLFLFLFLFSFSLFSLFLALFLLSSLNINSNLSRFCSIKVFILNKLCSYVKLGNLYPLLLYCFIISSKIYFVDFWKFSDIE